MSRFEFIQTPINDLKVVKRTSIGDSRGFLSRLFSAEEFREAGMSKEIVQINHTSTQKKGSVRGLHFQRPPHTETKIVTCLKGEIFDVAVDLRQDSPTFLQWHAEILSDENLKSILIPDGFAHGFQSMTENCELIYFHTAPYRQESEGALNARDPQLDIRWPLQFQVLSDRDRTHPFITPNFKGIL